MQSQNHGSKQCNEYQSNSERNSNTIRQTLFNLYQNNQPSAITCKMPSPFKKKMFGRVRESKSNC